jgi:hypothetical protein
LKNNAKVILNLGELFVSQFDASIGKKINFVLLNDWVKLIRCIPEEGSFDLSSMRIDQRDVENRPRILRLSSRGLV